MVAIYFRQESGQDIYALEIPSARISEFCLRPLKWLRFVSFAVLGAEGDLLGPDGNLVDDETSLDDIAESYYFIPRGEYHLVDIHGLNDHITTSTSAAREPEFRRQVMERDGSSCVITRRSATACQAAHIISHAKGDVYIHFVFRDRMYLYGGQQFDIDIDSVQNGMFLSNDLHALYAAGECVFLKTPNYGLVPADIPIVGTNDRVERTTIQHIIPHDSRVPIPQYDVLVDWTRPEAPPRILLDFMYGAAVVKRWGTDCYKGVLKRWHETSFGTLRSPSRSPSSESNSIESDNLAGSDFIPSNGEGGTQTSHKSKKSDLSEALDAIIAIAMIRRGYPSGTTLEMVCQKQEEEAEMRAHQLSKEKVQGWLGAGESFVSHGINVADLINSYTYDQSPNVHL